MKQPSQNQLLLLLIIFLIGCQSKPIKKADIIFHNGDIITMNDAQKIVEAIAVKDGKIIATGDWTTVQTYQGDSTEVRDLNGQTLLPSFIDAHSHFTIGMKMLGQANLNSPPVDSIRSIPDIIERLREHQQKFNISEGGWIIGWGYDPDLLVEKRHPTNTELTAAFPNNPVAVLHTSLHMAVANAKALALAKIDINTPDPEGGKIVRKPSSNQPTGLLQEKAMYMLFPLFPNPTPEQAAFLLDATQKLYASHGITTAQDGLTDSLTYAQLKAAAQQNALYLDLEILGSFVNTSAFLGREKFGEYNNRLRLAGMKITTDGSPQGKTAFFKDPYLTQVPGCIHECRGFPMVQPTQLADLMTACYANDIQLYVHCNGDASIDMLLETHEKVTDSLKIKNNQQRTVVIHSQFVRKDQLDKYAQYNFIPSFFTNHAFFWGDVHLENLGEERANFLSPMKSAMARDIVCTNHTDYVVTPINQLFLLWTSVVRTARSGTIIGEGERLTPYEGLKALTINSAYQHRVENIKGSLEVGKLADLVILDKNPLKVEPNEIKNLKVQETIKEGKVIFKRE